MRDWLETHAPRLLGVIDWPRYRLASRCIPCGRLMVLHTPWALYVCERTPLPIRITEQGMARIASDGREHDEPEPAAAIVV
jgi:hypothetical protein